MSTLLCYDEKKRTQGMQMGHYIIVDIEWIEKGTFVNPTQISAVKVNSDWKGLSHYCKATEASVAG